MWGLNSQPQDQGLRALLTEPARSPIYDLFLILEVHYLNQELHTCLSGFVFSFSWCKLNL